MATPWLRRAIIELKRTKCSKHPLLKLRHVRHSKLGFRKVMYTAYELALMLRHRAILSEVDNINQIRFIFRPRAEPHHDNYISGAFICERMAALANRLIKRRMNGLMPQPNQLRSKRSIAAYIGYHVGWLLPEEEMCERCAERNFNSKDAWARAGCVECVLTDEGNACVDCRNVDRPCSLIGRRGTYI